MLLAVNGGDGPLGAELQSRISALPGLKACYVHNLTRCDGPHAELFFPLPLGAMPINSMEQGDQLLSRVRAEAPPFAERDRRLLVAPMKLNSRQRARYLDLLQRPEFAPHVRIVASERLPLAEFLALISQHQCTLSPPGRGYDCFRTWQALAVGTVPLVPEDPVYDARLFELGPRRLPPPDRLTPTGLAEVLGALTAPDETSTQIGYWEQRWAAHFVK